MVRDLVYLSLLGNDPAPAYLGLKMVEQRTRGVARAIFYTLRVWNEVYETKRRALFFSQDLDKALNEALGLAGL